MRKLVFVLFPCVLLACVGDSGPTDGGSTDAGSDTPINTDSGGCTSPQTLCTKGQQSICTDIATDDQNCGSCNNVCVTATTCKSSKCACTDTTKTLCGSTCLDAQTDPKNCGACGHVCPNSDCTAGKCDPVVFVTDLPVATNLGGFAAYDAKCQSLAQTAGLSGTFMAWLTQSTTTASSPDTRFTKSTRPYVNVNGTVIADSYAALTSGAALKHAIDTSQSKQVMASGTLVMTSTNATGTTQGGDCMGWTGVAPGGAYGDPTTTTLAWSRSFSGTVDCTTVYRIYCFEQ